LNRGRLRLVGRAASVAKVVDDFEPTLRPIDHAA
jgi:hypothetical protein